MRKFLNMLYSPEGEGAAAEGETPGEEPNLDELPVAKEEEPKVTFEDMDEAIARQMEEEIAASGDKETEVVEEKKVETPVAVKEETVVDINVVESLQKIIAEMQGKQEPKKEESGDIKIELPPIEDEEYNAIFRDKSALDKMIARRIEEGINQHQKQATPKQMEVMTKLVNQQIFTYFTVESFYKEHPELAPYKTTVQVIANEIQAKNPDKPWHTLLPQVAEVTKKKLALAKKIVEKETPPAQPRGGRKAAAPSKQEMSEIEKEFAELVGR